MAFTFLRAPQKRGPAEDRFQRPLPEHGPRKANSASSGCIESGSYQRSGQDCRRRDRKPGRSAVLNVAGIYKGGSLEFADLGELERVYDVLGPWNDPHVAGLCPAVANACLPLIHPVFLPRRAHRPSLHGVKCVEPDCNRGPG